MAIVKITKDNYDAEVLQHAGKLILDFGAPWCKPCKKLEKTLEELGEEFDDVKIAKIDIEAEPDLAVKSGILSIPAIIYFKDGKIIKKVTGEQSKKALIKLITKK